MTDPFKDSHHLIEGKAPFDFMLQLKVWNYHYNQPTNQFFKYVGMGMLVLNADWSLMFIIKPKGKILVHSSETIKESIKEIPQTEALVFHQYLDINSPLMLEAKP